MSCHNPDKPELCLCPEDGDVRRMLTRKFINSWVGERLTDAANALAADTSVSDERLWRMLFTLEREASGAYCMWRNCQ